MRSANRFWIYDSVIKLGLFRVGNQDRRQSVVGGHRLRAPFFFAGRSLIATMCTGSKVAISRSLSKTARVCRPIKTNSGCGTVYSRPSEVRSENGRNPPLNRCRTRSIVMAKPYELFELESTCPERHFKGCAPEYPPRFAQSLRPSASHPNRLCHGRAPLQRRHPAL